VETLPREFLSSLSAINSTHPPPLIPLEGLDPTTEKIMRLMEHSAHIDTQIIEASKNSL